MQLVFFLVAFPLYFEFMENAFRNLGKFAFVVSTFALFLTTPLDANARSLSKRLGVGFVSQVAASSDRTLPMLDAKYYFSRRWAASLGIGFDTRTDGSEVAIGAKVFRNLFNNSEQNMNFYLGSGLAMLAKNGTKLQIQFFLGGEFFFQGLPSLGFSFEGGVRGDNSRGKFALRTTGDTFLNAGIHFYF